MNNEEYTPGQGHKEVGLNNYELSYFKKTFGTNMESLHLQMVHDKGRKDETHQANS